ncbi:MAG: neocarzinostatin apoprotein domain-containing protein [Acidimicrobiales bacterium]
MRPSKRGGIGVALAGVVALLLALAVAVPGAGAAWAAAAPPRIHLSQANDLASGQIITVHGSGFPPSTYPTIDECEPGATTLDECEGGEYYPVGAPDPKGTFNKAFQVSAQWNIGSKKIDCEVSPGCVIEAGLRYIVIAGNPTASERISFNPKAAPLLPALSLSAVSNLVPNQDVTVSGVNFGPLRRVLVWECAAGVSLVVAHCDYGQGPSSAFVDSGGRFKATYRVSSEIQEPPRGRIVSCEPPKACELAAALGFGGFLTSGPAIAFNTDATPIGPSETVSPTSELADGQSVQVTAAGFRPEVEVTVRECEAGGIVCTQDEIYPEASDTGSVSVTFTVAEHPGKLDCDIKTCVIEVSDDQDIWYSNAVPLSFDPSAPAFEPTIAVTPSTGLTDESVVSVSVGDFAVGTPVAVSECATVRRVLLCFEYAQLVADTAGGGETGLQVTSVIEATTRGTLIMCSSTHPCEVVTENENDPYQAASAPISFAGDS